MKSKPKPKTNPSEFVAVVKPGAKLGDFQGAYTNAPADAGKRAKAIKAAHKGLAKNAAQHQKDLKGK
jgi:hypothetical protein